MKNERSRLSINAIPSVNLRKISRNPDGVVLEEISVSVDEFEIERAYEYAKRIYKEISNKTEAETD